MIFLSVINSIEPSGVTPAGNDIILCNGTSGALPLKCNYAVINCNELTIIQYETAYFVCAIVIKSVVCGDFDTSHRQRWLFVSYCVDGFLKLGLSSTCKLYPRGTGIAHLMSFLTSPSLLTDF